MSKFSKFVENYKPNDPRISINPKHRKYEEDYPKAHCNQIAKN